MSLIIVSDSHIEPGGVRERTFFKMLTALGSRSHDVVFLGDIFRLWIALPGYEGKAQQDFLQWCRRQKASRTVGFIEGNHEFFVSAQHGDCFTWSTAESCRQDGKGNLFAHGDLINRHDTRYLLFRRLVKNGVTRMLLRHLPGGPGICNRLQQMLRHTNHKHRQGLPEEQIRAFARLNFGRGVRTIFAGHFHSAFQYAHTQSRILYLLPAWYASGQVTLVDTGRRAAPVQSANWEALLNQSERV